VSNHPRRSKIAQRADLIGDRHVWIEAMQLKKLEAFESEAREAVLRLLPQRLRSPAYGPFSF
jgi:hypothetical protein